MPPMTAYDRLWPLMTAYGRYAAYDRLWPPNASLLQPDHFDKRLSQHHKQGIGQDGKYGAATTPII